MRQVELNERTAEAIERDYIYTTSSKLVEYDGQGKVKKTETRVYEISWQQGVRIARLVSKNGKPLTGDDAKKEDERLQDAIAKAKARREKADSADKETDSQGREEITLSRMLELGSFSNPRRVQVNGRDTIAVNYTGDPKASVRNRAEGAVREMAGSVYVDEADRSIEHVEGQFINSYKVGGGLVVNVAKGTQFRIVNTRLNNEVWLPQSFDAKGHARLLLFFSLEGDLSARMSDYHKFRTSVTILPGASTVVNGSGSSEPAAPR